MKIETTVKEAFNDKERGYRYCGKGEKIILLKERYEELLRKGKVNKGTVLKEEKKKIKVKED